MIDFEYLSRGLNAMARAHQMSSMAGHLGASLVAGYFVGEQRPGLEPEVYAGIEDDLVRVMRGESVFGKKMSKNARIADSELFEPFPKQKPDETLIDGIAEALAKNIDEPRQSGHNVIFASIAIRALKEHPEFATASVVDGICKLIGLFNGATPGNGYYGKEKGRIHGNKIKLPEVDDFPHYKDVVEMADVVLDELIAQDPKVVRQGYGGLVHINNHAAAIADLVDYGYAELVPVALKSHHWHVRLYRDLPNVAEELGPLKMSKNAPHASGYWTSGEVPYDRALLTHRVKTMFGFDELVALVEDDSKRELAYQKLRYLM
jgi:hypothetical protein